MWVQPKVWQPIFLLKPIRATAYRFYYKKKKTEEPCSGGFFWSSFFRAVFFQERFFFQKKKRGVKLCVVLVQKSELQSSSFVAEKRQPYNLFFFVYFYRKVFLFRSDSEDSFRVISSSIFLDLRLYAYNFLFTIFR